jgi:septal ring factor EnvC (AmiA/AmiB activator)
VLPLALILLVAQPEPGFGGEPRRDPIDIGVETAQDAQEVGQQEKAAMRRRLADDRVRSSFLRNEESSILKAVDEIDRGLDNARKQLREIEKKELSLEKETRRVDLDLAGSRRRMLLLRQEIGRRAAAMLRMKRTPISDLVARASSQVVARKLRDRLAIVLGYDRDLVQRIEIESAAGERLSRELVERKAALEAAKTEIHAKTEDALGLREERAALLRAIQSERKMIERLASEIASAAKWLDSEIGVVHGTGAVPVALPGGFARQKGRLAWPVAGRVEVPFGKRVDPESDAVMAHKGLDIRAPFDEPVRAIFGGKVAFSSTLHGFGRVVILDHGEGWYSVYAHLEELSVEAGAEVLPRQVIGTVGESGSIKGPYLYFELRHGKDAVDPMGWLAR